ncbi:MAG: hypothetical protein ACLFQV_11405 [Vulcanimicrobiota bacterium]
MNRIYQNIIIGLDDLGDNLLKNMNRTFLQYNASFYEEAHLKICITPLENNKIEFSTSERKKGGLIQGIGFGKNTRIMLDHNQGKIDFGNRREFTKEFCTFFPSLKNSLKIELERISTDEFNDKLKENSIEIIGHKVFIVLDLTWGKPSSFLLPLLGSLRLLLKDFNIASWNVVGVTGLDKSDGGKLHALATLKELEFARNSAQPINFQLKTPPVNTEIDVAGENCNLYILDAQARGIQATTMGNIATLIGRFLFQETFQSYNLKAGNRLSFSSFNTGQCLFPLEDLVDSVTATWVSGINQSYQRIPDLPVEQKKELAARSLEMVTDIEPTEEDYFDYSGFLWRKEEIGFDALGPQPGLDNKLETIFKDRAKKQEDELRDALRPFISAFEQPLFVKLKDSIDTLMNRSFYGYLGAKAFVARHRNLIRKKINQLEETSETPPFVEELERKKDDLRNSYDKYTHKTGAIFAWFFALVPTLFFLAQFIAVKLNMNMFFLKILTIGISGVISFVMGTRQNSELRERLKISFEEYRDDLQKYSQVVYNKKLKLVTLRYYKEMLSLLTGEDDNEEAVGSKTDIDPETKQITIKKEEAVGIHPDVLKAEPLYALVEKYMAVIKNYQYTSIPTPRRVFNSLILYKADNEEDLQNFSQRFLSDLYSLGGDITLEDASELFSHLVNLSRAPGSGLHFPDWKDVVRDPEKTGDFYECIKKIIHDDLEKITRESQLDVLKVIQRIFDGNYTSLLEKLETMASPMISLKQGNSEDGENISSQNIILIGAKTADFEEFVKTLNSSNLSFKNIEPVENLFMIYRSFQGLVLSNLPDFEAWQKLEQELTLDEKYRLYIFNSILEKNNIVGGTS